MNIFLPRGIDIPPRGGFLVIGCTPGVGKTHRWRQI